VLTPDEALCRILSAVRPGPVETVPLAAAWDRVLAEEVVAAGDLPPFDNSAMDGYALRARDTVGAAEDRPVRLGVLEDLPAGRVAARPLEPGTAMRIMTGAPLPAGADAVVPVERTLPGPGTVDVLQEARPGQNVRLTGEDIRAGQRILHRGTRIRAAELGVLAALGRPYVQVFQRPRIAVLTTGDELVDVEAPLRWGQIRDSNAYALSALVREYGGEVGAVRRAIDTHDALRTALDQLPEVDFILTSGGVSVGDYDLVREVVEERGQVLFWRVAIKPGKPFLFGQIGDRWLFGLPGNPVSAMVTCDLFVRPALFQRSGRTDWSRPRVPTRLTVALRSDPQRLEYVRARTEYRDGAWRSTPTGDQGSGRLSSMLGANSYVLLPIGLAEASPHTELQAELFG
jgi:molybdopterin molybdotransferase